MDQGTLDRPGVRAFELDAWVYELSLRGRRQRPLMWVIPLALYLLSFIFAFARATPSWVHRAMVLGLPLALCLQLASEGTLGLGNLVATHLATHGQRA